VAWYAAGDCPTGDACVSWVCIELAAPACSWQDRSITVPGQCCWTSLGNASDSRAECQELDGCLPGGGQGGTGDACYKWATSSEWEDVPPW
jgi:hypothetical protein